MREKNEQLTHDSLKLKNLNLDLHSQITALQNKVMTCETALQNKSLENDALQYTIKLWENRRRAAKEAGKLTVEDVLADKMKLAILHC